MGTVFRGTTELVMMRDAQRDNYFNSVLFNFTSQWYFFIFGPSI
jgi:hypothetical protein